MIILLNKSLDCETLCNKINKLIKTELSDTENFQDYALSITISRVVDEKKEEEIAKLPLKNK